MRRELLLVQEMIDAAERAISLVDGLALDALEGDRLRSEALLWNFTVLGEAAGQVDEEVKARFSDLDWTRPTRLRNRIVHGYWSADMAILHATAVQDLPGFAARLNEVLTELRGSEA